MGRALLHLTQESSRLLPSEAEPHESVDLRPWTIYLSWRSRHLSWFVLRLQRSTKEGEDTPVEQRYLPTPIVRDWTELGRRR